MEPLRVTAKAKGSGAESRLRMDAGPAKLRGRGDAKWTPPADVKKMKVTVDIA